MFISSEPPTDVRVTDITKNSITLAWLKPSYAGGSKITGYIIEKRDGANNRWTKANLANVSSQRFTVQGLTQDESYEFRVMAKNAIGSISNPSSIVGPVTCVDTFGKISSVDNDAVICILTVHYRFSFTNANKLN